MSYEIGNRVCVLQGRNAGYTGTVEGVNGDNLFVNFHRMITVRDDPFDATSGWEELDAYWVPTHMVTQE